MEQSEKQLRHDIRGAFQGLVFSTEVLRGALPTKDRDIFLTHVVESCEKLEALIGQVACQREKRSP